MKNSTNRIIKTFFWFAFASFLGASIPHVAYFFRAFEPQEKSFDYLYWVVAGAIAVSIDVMVFLLSVTVAQMQHRKASAATIVTVWLFIILLSGLSWFINWQYAEQFTSEMLSKVVGQNVGLFRVGSIDPIIASMFQAFAIAYTYIADKIATGKPKTAAELEQEADEEEEREQQQARLDAIRRKKRERRMSGLIGTVEMVTQQVLKSPEPATADSTIGGQALPEKLEQTLRFFQEKPELLSDDGVEVDEQLAAYLSLKRVPSARFWRLKAVEILERTTSVPTVLLSEQADQNRDQTMAVHGVKLIEQSGQNTIKDGGKTDSKMGERSEQNGAIALSDPGIITALNRFPKMQSFLTAGRRTVTIDEIVDVTMQSKRKVINRVRDGTLKRAPRNGQLILINSLIDWLKTAPPPSQTVTAPHEQLEVSPVEKLAETSI